MFKTLDRHKDDMINHKFREPLPEIIFMCIANDELNHLCELFPQTAQNIKRRSLERRQKFIQLKNMNSKRFW